MKTIFLKKVFDKRGRFWYNTKGLREAKICEVADTHGCVAIWPYLSGNSYGAEYH